MKVYLGGPITGLSVEQCTGWRTEMAQRLAGFGYETRDPMRDKEHLTVHFADQPLPSRFDEEEDAVTRDLRDITECDVILVNLVGATRVSIGTMCELGYAKAKEKRIIVVMGDEAENPHDHLFVHQLASEIVETLDEATSLLEEYALVRG